MRPLLTALALAACGPDVRPWTPLAPPSGRWAPTPAWTEEARIILDACREVTGDRIGFLARGGMIRVRLYPEVCEDCAAPGRDLEHTSGCAFGPGHLIELRLDPAKGLGPAPRTTSLAHECCHLGLGTDDETRADACGKIVLTKAFGSNQKETP